MFENYILDRKRLRNVVPGFLIGGFIAILIELKYSNNENIYLFILGVSLIIYIAKWDFIDIIWNGYNSLISKQMERILLVVLLILSYFSVKVPNDFYFYIILINFNILLYVLFDSFLLKNNQKELTKPKKIFSFRKKELERLKNLVNDTAVTTILIDEKIGNGKTFLLETFLEEPDLGFQLEVIYLKLPLLKTADYLKKIVLSELFKILNKNRISIKKGDVLFEKLQKMKIGIFEFKTDFNKSNWDSIKDLEIGIKELQTEKRKKILIILDDIEREEDLKKIKDSILFLGELSEYFRNTSTTTLFLAQFDKISKHGDVEGKFNLFEKYFSQKIRLYSPEFEELEENDLIILIEESVGNTLELKQHSILILELLRTLKILKTDLLKKRFLMLDENKIEIFNKSIKIENESLRGLSRYIKYFEDDIKSEGLNNNSQLIWCYIYKAFETFLPSLKYEIIKEFEINKFIYEELKQKLNGRIAIVNIELSINEHEHVKKIYLQGGLLEEINRNNIEKILDHLNRSSDHEIKFEEEINGKESSELFGKINSKNINKFLKMKLKFEYSISENLIKILNDIKNLDNIESESLKNLFNIFRKEIEEKNFYALFYTGDTWHISEDECIDDEQMKDEEKINTLTNFREILIIYEKRIREEMNIDISDILKNLEEHIKRPGLNSSDYRDLDNN